MKTIAIHQKDCYKIGHPFQYPEGTNLVYSNFTPRSGRLSNTGLDYIVWCGIQGVAKWLLIDEFNKTFFGVDKETACKRYKRRVDGMLGPDAVDISHIEALHDLGYLPVEIKALPEGSKVPYKVPVFTIKNTHPNDNLFGWVTNMLETMLSTECWKMPTVATTAHAYRLLLEEYAERTGSPVEFVDWQGHDFSMRGMSGIHDAAQSGLGHLLSFLGTDTVPAIDYAEEYYGANVETELVGGSVPASEHSVMCAGGKEDEVATIRRLIKDVYPSGVVSIVSDTWDFWNVITNTASALKEDILNRKPNALGLAKTVFRPDSGDPVEVICGKSKPKAYFSIPEAIEALEDDLREEMNEECGQGYCGDTYAEEIVQIGDEYYLLSFSIDYHAQWCEYGENLFHVESVKHKNTTKVELTPKQKGAVECLWDVFGGTINDKGYKVLNERVGLIYGDSITLERAKSILSGLEAKGFASCNIVFGIGSYTYQYVTRDTHGFAMKATYAEVNGEGREIFKDPVTDSGTKKSAKGLLRVEKENGTLVLYDQQTWEQEAQGELKTVFKDGKLVNETSLAEMRERLKGK